MPPPGPPPRRPTPADAEAVDEQWIADQRDSEARTNRPLHVALVGLGVFALLCPLLWSLRVLPGNLAVGGVLACVTIAAPIVFALLQSRQVIAGRLMLARERLEAERAARENALRERLDEHAREHTAWQAACRAFEARPLWYGVTAPADTGAIIVVGGADAGWSALLTTIGVSRLREGGDLTVVDLTGRSVTRDLVRLARRCAVAPRRWVLPADLPCMTLGTDLDAGQRARILSAVAAASGTVDDVDADETLLLRLMEVLGPRAGIAELIGGLRALITPEGDAAEDDPALALLTPDQRARVRERCAGGHWDRAWELERRLSPFEAVGTRAEDGAYAQVKIISTDRASGEVAARVYGTYAVAALSELLEVAGVPADEARRARGRRGRTVVVCGAETLPEGEIDQVLAAAGSGGVEVVLMFRTAVPAALARFTGPGRLPVVMRQEEGTAPAVADAIAAHPSGGRSGGAARSALHRLTETVAEEVGEGATAPEEDPDAEVAADDRFFASPHTDSGAVIRNAAAAVAPLDLVRHVRSATVWGRATAAQEWADAPLSAEDDPTRHTRPFSPDADALCALPATAALVLGPDGPVLADTNPGILTLSTATLATVDDSRISGDETGAVAGASTEARGHDGGVRPRILPAVAAPDTPVGAVPDPVGTDGAVGRVPPNLGPPPERLDWRSR
ncbi:hypothetical protein [Nocardiopsis lambiniae]|uniref:Type VII secretion protein EccE n=1 Tax=Nocardiopsis lambiniae TaxID=3075539 RepID=A0ABU2M7N4_9ACTN|nr:hypothetical protein [Nocardiopsis sp. DSM 44743]MDT0328256.1 hypothetical protein [Nocardiopsis sp. DSM 44743]